MTDTIRQTHRPRRMARTTHSDSGDKHSTPGSPEAGIATETGTQTSSANAALARAMPATTRSPSKTGLVLTLLQSPEGATLDQLATATNWLPHTTRARLTGLRKKGHALTSTKPDDGPRVYHISAPECAMETAA